MKDLAYIGFTLVFDNPEWAKSGHYIIEQDQALAADMWNLTIHLVAQRAITTEWYNIYPLDSLAGLLGGPAQKSKCLARAKLLCEAP